MPVAKVITMYIFMYETVVVFHCFLSLSFIISLSIPLSIAYRNLSIDCYTYLLKLLPIHVKHA